MTVSASYSILTEEAAGLRSDNLLPRACILSSTLPPDTHILTMLRCSSSVYSVTDARACGRRQFGRTFSLVDYDRGRIGEYFGLGRGKMRRRTYMGPPRSASIQLFVRKGAL